MKITMPTLEIEEFEGFTKENDIFNREYFAEQLTNLIVNTDDELVVALDSPWGQGKTTFVKMWRGLLYKKGIKSIYYDAFKNDYTHDPLLTLLSDVNEIIIDELKDAKGAEFKKNAISILKTVGKVGLRIGLRTITSGIVDDTVFKNAEIGDELTNISDDFIEKRFNELHTDKNFIDKFKISLNEIVEEIGETGKLAFFIDELDRCRPDFAIDLIEKIKHFLSVPNIVFVFVINRTQMEEIIKIRYGSGIDGLKYLQKFVHVWTSLPQNYNDYKSNGKIYLEYCLNRMNFEQSNSSYGDVIDIYSNLLNYYNLSFREIERSLSNFAIMQNVTNGFNKYDYIWIAIYISIIKVLYPDIFIKLFDKTINYPDLVKDTNLENLVDQPHLTKFESHRLKEKLRVELSSKEELVELNKKYSDQHSSGLYKQEIISEICNWLGRFQV